MIYDLIIVGAGASGLVAAYRAASLTNKLNIMVIEKEQVPGRKLSAAGNGRCNLTNQYFEASCYHSHEQEKIAEWTSKHSYLDILQFFENIGVLLYETEGYYYPRSNQGKQVTQMLMEKCRQLGVSFFFESDVTRIDFLENEGYKLTVSGQGGKSYTYHAKNVILSAGAPAYPALGGSDLGLRLLSGLQVKFRPFFPALSPIYVTDPWLKLAKGVRLDAAVSLKGMDGTTIKEKGQVQFNEDCLSGIVIMNLSCYYNRWKEADSLYLDALPELSWEQLKNYFMKQQKQFPDETITQMLYGLFPKSFVKYLVKRLEWKEDMSVNSLSEKKMNQLTSAIKKLTFTPIYKENYDKAQVAGGGVELSEILMDTFESRQYPGLYITGELLDVYGRCGGYNLTFAILSGKEAAENVVKRCEELENDRN